MSSTLLNQVISNIRQGELLLGDNYVMLMEALSIDLHKEINNSGELQVNHILMQLRLGGELTGFDYVVLHEYLQKDEALGYGLKKHFITIQKYVSKNMRSTIMREFPSLNRLSSHPLLDALKNLFLGKKITLDYMDDPRPVPVGTTGVVNCIDDAGQLNVKWDNGRHLAVVLDAGDFITVQG
jgi:hypothetical protein